MKPPSGTAASKKRLSEPGAEGSAAFIARLDSMGAARRLRAARKGEFSRTERALYNHAEWYVQEVEAKAAKLGGEVICTATAASFVGGEADLRHVETLYEPRAFKPIPSRYWAGGGPPESVDSRLWPDLIWVLTSFDLRVTAAREAGHETHGDGTAVDLVPATGRGWDESALRAAETLGWRSDCGASGTAPVCPLAPAIQFIGYNGYSGHGDPAHAGSNAHLHISWQGASYGCAELCSPPRWVRVFPLSP